MYIQGLYKYIIQMYLFSHQQPDTAEVGYFNRRLMVRSNWTIQPALKNLMPAFCIREAENRNDPHRKSTRLVSRSATKFGDSSFSVAGPTA